MNAHARINGPDISGHDSPSDHRNAMIEVEQSLLGAILNNQDALSVAEALVAAADFSEPVHQELFARFVEARDRGDSITLQLVIATLGKFGDVDLGGVTVRQYAARLAAAATTVINTRDFAKAIRDAADRRRIVDLGDTLKARIEADCETLDTARVAIDELDSIVAARLDASQKPVMMGEAADAAMNRMTAALQNGGRVSGIPTGLASLDNRIGGLQRGEFVVLAGRPGMGKSGLAVTVARLAGQAGFNVDLYSLEMGREAIADRAMADLVWERGRGIPYSELSRGRLTNEQAERIVEAGRAFRSLPVRIDTQAGLTIGQIAARARKHKRDLERRGKSLDLVVVDHMHIVRASDRYAGNSVREVTEISGALKAMAKELNVPVMALAQLNRATEARDNKRPSMSDLRESGSIEQDADLIMLMYREAYYLERLKSDDPAENDKRVARLLEVRNLVEVNVAKQRNGPVGPVELFCDIGCNVFRDLEDRR